ncbi:MAG: hypothetical protein V4670_01460 [Bacteroidota bacterium]
MKIKILLFFLFIQTLVFSQKPCDYSVNVTDSIGTLKETKSCLVYEKVFGNKTTLIFISLQSVNGVPLLKLQCIQKSKEFDAPKCLDKNSRIVFQLSNGKIYTLIYSEDAKCDDLVYNETEKTNNRYLDAGFLFLKDDFEEITKHSISLMRIRFSGGSEDFVLSKELISETLKETFKPDSFFINHFNCIAN